MSSLYELTGEYLRLMDIADDPEIDAEVLADTLEALDGEIEVKADNCAKLIRNLTTQIEALDSEIERLSKRKASMNNTIDAVKKNLYVAMKATGKTKFKSELFSFNIQKNAPSLVLNDDVDINKLPAEYLKFAKPTIDKTLVKNALKEGAEFDWAHLEQKDSLRIK